jgi:hypothetical protein
LNRSKIHLSRSTFAGISSESPRIAISYPQEFRFVMPPSRKLDGYCVLPFRSVEPRPNDR